MAWPANFKEWNIYLLPKRRLYSGGASKFVEIAKGFDIYKL